MTGLIYHLFGQRKGRIISGAFFLICGIIYLMLNLGDPEFTDTSDWVYCVILLVVGGGLLVFGLLNGNRDEAQSARARSQSQNYPPR